MSHYVRNMPRYGKALRTVEARLRRIHAAGDPRLALGDKALDEAAELSTGGSHRAGHRRRIPPAASALNSVMLDFRDRKPRSPSLWASHLHTGI